MTDDNEELSEKGPWVSGIDYIQSDDFTHDVRLKVTGDFANKQDKQRYTARLCEWLNKMPKDWIANA